MMNSRVMHVASAASRQGLCSTSGRRSEFISPFSCYGRPSRRHAAREGRRMQKCRASQDTGDDDLDKFNDEYINLGPQWQIPNPEEGPLEQRVATTFIEGLFKGEPNLEESNYWFTEPPGGWNQEDKIVKKAKQIPVTYPGADHPGPGRRPLSDFLEGMEMTGIVEALYLYHGVRVDLGGEFDGLLPVDGTEEAWELLGTSFQIDMQVKVRVHKIFNAPRCRFPIQLELLEPAHLIDKMLPPDEYAPSYDLRGLSTVEDIAWATGMTIDEITGGREAELTVLTSKQLQKMKGEVSSVTTMEQWPAQLRQGAPPPPLPVYAPPTEADFYAAESDLF